MKHTKRSFLSLLLALFLVIGLMPGQVFAANAESNVPSDGVYDAKQMSVTLGMWSLDNVDFTSYVVVKDGKITLVTRSYAPNRFDAVWMGKRSEAPENAAAVEVITGKLIEADEAYIASGAYKKNIYTGEDGKKYKAIEFEIPLTEEQLTSDVYFVLRYGEWYTNSDGVNIGLTWCGSKDQSFKVGELTQKTADIKASISIKGEVKLALTDVTVKDTDYDGVISAGEALIAIHDAYYDGGAAGFGENGGFINKFWGIDTSAVMYWKNNVSCYSLDDALEEGDILYAYVFKDDAAWSDKYSMFDAFEYTSEDGTLDVALQKDDGSWSSTYVAATGATITVCDETLKAVDTSKYTVTDNEDGTYSLTFLEAGSYIMVATDTESNIVPAISAVTVNKAYVPAVTAEVDFTAQMSGAFLMPPQLGVSVSSDLAESYGYTDSVADGVSALDVLVKAHELVFGEDFTKDTATDYLELSGSFVTVQFGVSYDETDISGGFFLNHGFANDGTESSYGGWNGTTVDTQKVVDGDLVEFFFYEDEYYGDSYNWFLGADEEYSREFTVDAGEDLDLTLTGFYAMEGYRFKDAAEMIASDSAYAVEDAQIYTVDLETGTLTEIAGAVTDEDGLVTLKFADPGTYTITAYSTEDCMFTQILTLTTVTVKGPEETKLAITNNTGMFKLVSATAYTMSDGSGKIVFALSGTGYHNLFKGTYEEAVANGDNRDNWIVGKTNADGKWEFELPIEAGETYIPVVAISQSYLEKYEQGQNPLARAFFPRQLTLDLEAKTIVSDDYSITKELAVTNNVKRFVVEDIASLTTIGGPNSNNYSSLFTLNMGNATFDKAFIGSAEDAAKEGAKTIAFVPTEDGSKGSFTFTVMSMKTAGDPSTVESLLGKAFVISFHSSKGWYERAFTIDETAGTVVIDPVVKIKASVSVKGEVKLALKNVSVIDLNGDKTYSAGEALIAIHEANYEGGAAGFGENEGLINKLWGVETTAVMYWKNNVSCYSLDDALAEGDVLYAYVFKDDAYWTDAYSMFDAFDYTSENGTLDVALQKDDGTWSSTYVAASGATITVYDEDFKAVEKSLYKVTDKGEGTYSLEFYQKGEFTIIATDEASNIVPAISKVVVNNNVVREGWIDEDGTWYYYVDGVAQTGWKQISSKWYYFNDDGSMVTGWKQISGKWYYFNAGGSMVTGWKQISGKWYYFNDGGSMVTGWKQISGKWYYFNDGGSMVTGWKQISGKWYYFRDSGAMATGWAQVNEKWYYFNESGTMVTGWQTIDGKTYFFKSSGVMAENEWCQGWWLNKGGTWTYQYKASWKQDSKGWYYQDTSGWYARNATYIIDGTSYTFDASGYWVQ